MEKDSVRPQSWMTGHYHEGGYAHDVDTQTHHASWYFSFGSAFNMIVDYSILQFISIHNSIL